MVHPHIEAEAEAEEGGSEEGYEGSDYGDGEESDTESELSMHCYDQREYGSSGEEMSSEDEASSEGERQGQWEARDALQEAPGVLFHDKVLQGAACAPLFALPRVSRSRQVSLPTQRPALHAVESRVGHNQCADALLALSERYLLIQQVSPSPSSQHHRAINKRKA
jgi:hypothetical protein